jgi:cytochrome c-type biogenesis protein
MNAMLLVTAALLGLLAFFEPCTIATHTLFAARASHDAARRRLAALAQLMLSRSALLAAIFGIVAAIGLDGISALKATLMLGVMGAVYLLSRRIYLPVPHVEFFRLMPGGPRLPQALKLGLTLPACTLPLVAVVGVLSALTRRPDIAALAGLVFAVTFSLPTVWDSLHGLSAARRSFLGWAAGTTPYLTTLLLWSGAVVIWKTGI